ncbi:Fungal specific transcription factor domain-containing protein [Cladophialophora immunda]|nr:Fungal specific transcription factor domain-containing protein [Cladophialophora immunda]
MSEVETTPTDGKVIKRACTECRQQKARCDAYLDPDQPCTRCRKMNRQCIISEPFKREHKRKRLSELEHRTDELQERLRSSSHHPEAAAPLPQSSWAAVNDLRTANAESESRLASVAPFFRDAAIAPTPESLAHDYQPSGTLPRCLEGQSVDSKDIDAMFQLYFREYAGLIPILDPTLPPNGYYNLSPLLFWAIIGVSCRTYSRNPTLISILPAKIKTMALMSLNATITLPVVQALLLILYWPFPKSGNGHDMTYPLSAAVLHMAMQIGLHVPVASHEFCKNPVKLTEDELKIRAETWGYCTLVYQRGCCFKGSPPTPMLDVPHDLEQRRALFQRISSNLKFELKLQDVVTRCCIAVSQNGLWRMTADQERSLDSLLSIFQAQISSVALEPSSDLDQLYVNIATLIIHAFNLYKSPTAHDPSTLYDLCASCCQVIESFDKLDKSGQVCLSGAGLYFFYSLMVTCHVLLRLLKTSLSRYIDVERAKTALFLGISLHKRMSVQNDDLPARNGVALTQLWNSTRVFKRPNGTEVIALRIRSRLIGSVVLDGIVWWREEFGGFMGVYPPPLSDNRTEGTEAANDSNSAAPDDGSMPVAAKPDYSTFLDDPMLTEFGWPVTDDVFSSIWTDGPIATI